MTETLPEPSPDASPADEAAAPLTAVDQQGGSATADATSESSGALGKAMADDARSAEDADAAGTGHDRRDRSADLEQEGEVAADYLEGLLDIIDLDGDLDLDVEGDRAVVAIVGADGLDKLVGKGGATLDALQELTRLAVVTATGGRSRLMLDIAGWRAQRRVELVAKADSVASSVRSTGEARKLEPMRPYERKIVHDALAGADGVITESEGVEPNRRVVVLPA